MKTHSNFSACLPTIILFLCFSTPVSAGATLDQLRSRGFLRCGVSQSLTGFAEKDSAGRWTGFHVDFCRAVAAAALGDADKVEIIPVSTASRLPLLLSKQVDLLAHTTSQTFSRESMIGVDFAGIYFFTTHTFLVPNASPVNKEQDLNKSTLCVEKGSSTEINLKDLFTRSNLQYKPLVLESLSELSATLQAGHCAAIFSARDKLIALKNNIPNGTDKYKVLPQDYVMELTGPVVRRGDEEWLALVRWTLFALIKAEELGVTQSNVLALRGQSTDPTQHRLLVDSGAMGVGLKLAPEWLSRVIGAVGNYGEIYGRNLGEASQLKIDRAYNRLWKNGGLLYSPDFQ